MGTSHEVYQITTLYCLAEEDHWSSEGWNNALSDIIQSSLAAEHLLIGNDPISNIVPRVKVEPLLYVCVCPP